MISFPLGTEGGAIIVAEAVLDHFERHRQRRFYQREAGGQLFARFDGANAVIEEATGPRRADWRTRYSYRAHRPTEQGEIEACFARGLHYVGDWHSHPEDRPVPSSSDAQTIIDISHKSSHALTGLILIIVGRLAFPGGLFVGLTRPNSIFELNARQSDKGSPWLFIPTNGVLAARASD